MQKSKNAFTMIELVFVIVILGILSAVAIPKFAATRTDAEISKGRADISSIRSSIVTERQSRLIKGDSSWISKLSDNDDKLFTGSDDNHTLLLYGISPGTNNGHWSVRDNNYSKYMYKVGGKDCNLTYYDNNGKFILDDSQPTICDKLVK